MSLKSMFGDYSTPVDDGANNLPESSPTPLDDTASTGGTPTSSVTQADDEATVYTFQGFASPIPLLAERPSLYIRRMRDAMGSMITTPDDDPHGGVENRILYSPAAALPFPVLYGNELFASETVFAYPLLHAPRNHQPYGDIRLDEYALTLTILYTATGIMRETDGNVLAYRLQDPFEVEDETWDEAAGLAHDMLDPLSRLNRARLLGFAVNDWANEGESLSLLFDAWEEERGPSDILADGQKAASELEDAYRTLYEGLPYQPFNER